MTTRKKIALKIFNNKGVNYATKKYIIKFSFIFFREY